MGPFTPTTQDTTVYTLAAQMMADATNDGDRARIDRALDLVASVERLPSGQWSVPSSTGQGGYVVSRDARTCDCPDYTRRETACKHIFSVRLALQVERAEVDAEQAFPQPEQCVRCGVLGDRHTMRCIAMATGFGPAQWVCDPACPPAIRVDPEDSILDLWPVGDGEPCAIDSTQTGRRITVLPYTPAQAAIASELYADEPQGAA